MKKLVIVVIFVFAIFILFVLTMAPSFFPKPNPTPTPTPYTPQPTGSGSNNYNVDSYTKTQLQREYYVSKLIGIVPYEGKDFALDYNIKSAMFVLTIKQNAQQAGNQEFDAFLKQNQIQDRSWISNLTISIEPITPAP